jgi:hypothetical protein
VWESELGRSGVDLWLTATALANRFDVGEVVLGVRTQPAGQARMPLSELFGQVVGALFSCIEMHERVWRGQPGAAPARAPAPGVFDDAPAPAPADTIALVESFRRDIVAIRPILGQLLSPSTLAGVLVAADARGGAFALPDDLWVATVYEFAASYHRSVIHRQHVTQALVPLYLGRVASFLTEHAGQPASSVWKGLEALCQQYERALPGLAARWSDGEAR